MMGLREGEEFPGSGRSKCKGPGLGELAAFPGAAQRAWAEARSGRSESEGPRCHLRAQLG